MKHGDTYLVITMSMLGLFYSYTHLNNFSVVSQWKWCKPGNPIYQIFV